MAQDSIALPLDDQAPPTGISRLRANLPVKWTRYATIIIGDIAFVLFLITHIIYQGKCVILIIALLPMLAVSVLNAIILWKERHMKESGTRNHSRDAVSLWIMLPVNLCSWHAILVIAGWWHFKLWVDHHGIDRVIVGTYCGMLLLLDLVLIVPLLLDGILCLLELGSKKPAKRYFRVSAADPEGVVSYRDEPRVGEDDGA